MTIPIAEHVRNIDRLRVHRDGDAFFVAWDDFVDLQHSPVHFIRDARITNALRTWWGVPDPLVHLMHTERCYLSKRIMAAENRRVTVTRENESDERKV